MGNKKGWIGVDFDGTLSKYSKLTPLLSFGEPVWPMVERVKQWLSDGYEVRIVTARAAPPFVCHLNPTKNYELKDVVSAIQDWCEKYIGQRLPVTSSKDFDMIELWDDRAVQVVPNEGEPTTYWVSRVA